MRVASLPVLLAPCGADCLEDHADRRRAGIDGADAPFARVRGPAVTTATRVRWRATEFSSAPSGPFRGWRCLPPLACSGASGHRAVVGGAAQMGSEPASGRHSPAGGRSSGFSVSSRLIRILQSGCRDRAGRARGSGREAANAASSDDLDRRLQRCRFTQPAGHRGGDHPAVSLTRPTARASHAPLGTRTDTPRRAADAEGVSRGRASEPSTLITRGGVTAGYITRTPRPITRPASSSSIARAASANGNVCAEILTLP
jgi:hypothetical protein